MDIQRLPVFSVNSKYPAGEKLYRMIDGETNDLARGADGELLDGGGISNQFVALKLEGRINEKRGLDNPRGLALANSLRADIHSALDIEEQIWRNDVLNALGEPARVERKWYRTGPASKKDMAKRLFPRRNPKSAVDSLNSLINDGVVVCDSLNRQTHMFAIDANWLPQEEDSP